MVCTPVAGFKLTATDNVVPFGKRNAEPEVYMPRDGTNLEDPVRMDRFGNTLLKSILMSQGRIIKARDYNRQ